jgi:hypothetical protein
MKLGEMRGAAENNGHGARGPRVNDTDNATIDIAKHHAGLWGVDGVIG